MGISKGVERRAWLGRLFVQSPFEPMLAHQQKVQECAERVKGLVDACLAGEFARVREFAKEISVLEGEADSVKTAVRDGLPKSVWLPVARGDLLEALSGQDAIADCAEDIGVLLTMRQMEPLPDEVAQLLRKLVGSSLAVVTRATEVVAELNRALDTSLGESGRQSVIAVIDEVDRLEHEADKIQDQFAKSLFRNEDALKPAALILWLRVGEKIGELANSAERMAHRVRLFIARG